MWFGRWVIKYGGPGETDHAKNGSYDEDLLIVSLYRDAGGNGLTHRQVAFCARAWPASDPKTDIGTAFTSHQASPTER